MRKIEGGEFSVKNIICTNYVGGAGVCRDWRCSEEGHLYDTVNLESDRTCYR